MVGILINEKLLASSGVTDLVGDKIFPLIVPEKKTLPYLIYGVRTNTPDYVKTGSGVYGGVIDNMSVFIEISSMNYKELQDLIVEVRKSIESSVLIHLDSETKPITLSSIGEQYDVKSRNFNAIIEFSVLINRKSL